MKEESMNDQKFPIDQSSEQLVNAIVQCVEVMDPLKINCEWSCHMDKPLAFLSFSQAVKRQEARGRGRKERIVTFDDAIEMK